MPDARKVNAGRERAVAEQVTPAVRRLGARILEINGERRLAGKNEARVIGRLLLALRLRGTARLEEVAQQEMRRARQTAAAAVLQQAVDAEGPAGKRLDRELRAEQ